MLSLIITGREKNIKELVEIRTIELERANKVKSEFLANMSHEIRTPMNGVLGMLTLLETTKPSVEQTEYLVSAKKSVMALLTIINDILDVSKLENKKLELVPVTTNVTRLCKDIIQLFKIEANNKNLTLNLKVFKEKEDLFILIDENRLRQIIINILGNALKFTHNGSVTLNINLNEGKNLLIFQIIDTGIGISEENIERLFNRFVQLEDTKTKKFEGAGLGLFITKQLIDLMGGNIKIQSKLGEGSNFQIEIPFHEVEAPKVEHTPDQIPENYKSLNILVAEDNPVNQLYVKRILEKKGFQVTIANNGIELLKIIDDTIKNETKFDLILMDIQMPEMDGITATKLIRNRNDYVKEIPIIALTANNMDFQVQEYLGNGIDACVKKPIVLKDLLDILQNIIDR